VPTLIFGGSLAARTFCGFGAERGPSKVSLTLLVYQA
jgi:hypothetical protein